MDNLSGKRIVVTRPEKQSESFVAMLSAAGAVPICLPVIEISPVEDPQILDAALENLAQYDWLVLTSVNGVAAVWHRFAALGIDDLPETLKLACIGPKTAAALESKGYSPDYVPEEYVAEAILPGLGRLEGLRVLLTRADIARPDLPEAIEAGGGTADDVCAYRTMPTEPDQDALAEIAAGVDVLTFTSPSTVENFFQMVRQNGLDPLNLPNRPIVACIGPITAQAASKQGCQVAVIPEEYTIEGLFSALQTYFQEGVKGA